MYLYIDTFEDDIYFIFDIDVTILCKSPGDHGARPQGGFGGVYGLLLLFG